MCHDKFQNKFCRPSNVDSNGIKDKQSYWLSKDPGDQHPYIASKPRKSANQEKACVTNNPEKFLQEIRRSGSKQFVLCVTSNFMNSDDIQRYYDAMDHFSAKCKSTGLKLKIHDGNLKHFKECNNEDEWSCCLPADKWKATKCDQALCDSPDTILGSHGGGCD